MKIESYVESTNIAHISFCLDQEIEKSNQFVRIKNVNIQIYLKMKKVKNIVTKILAETLYISNPNLAQAFHIGNIEAQPQAIIVKFVDQTQHDTDFSN